MISWGFGFSTLERRFGAQPLIYDAGGAATPYSEVFARAAGIAHRLLQHGIGPGTPVATLLPNGVDALCASLGVTSSGACEVPLSVHQSDAERRHCLSIAAVRAVVTDASGAAALADIPVPVYLVTDMTPSISGAGSLPAVADDTWGRILFTSGTTAAPKGVIHTHRGRWIADLMLRAQLPFTPRHGDNLLLMTPFSHGASLLTYAWMATGGAVTLLPGVDPAIVLPLLQSGRVNSMFAPPTVLAKILASLGEGRIPNMRTIFSGTATLPRDLYRTARQAFGPVVRVTYGMTEIFNPITVLEPSDTDRMYGVSGADASFGACLGWPAPGVEVQIRDEAGKPVAPGETGEVCVRAPHAYAGYVTAHGFQARDPASFHATGDIGNIDQDGRVYLQGRMNDIIKTGGYKVTPHEIEEHLAAAVPNCSFVVVGLPSDYWGEVIVGVAERPAPGWQNRIADRVNALSAHKKPRLLVQLPELPRNAIGKISRKDVARKVLESYDLLDGPHPRLHERRREAN